MEKNEVKEIKKEIAMSQFRNDAVEVVTSIDNALDVMGDVYGDFKIKKEDITQLLSLFVASLMAVFFGEKKINVDFKMNTALLVRSIFIKEGDE